MASTTSMTVRVGSDSRPSLTLEHDRVLYVVDGPRVRAAVTRAAARLGVEDRVVILDLAGFALPA